MLADNSALIEYANENGVKTYELAHAYGVSQYHFYKIMKYEFSNEEKKYLVELVNKIVDGADLKELYIASKERRVSKKISRVDKWLAKQDRDIIRKMDRYSVEDEADYDRHTAEAIRSISDRIMERMEND